MNKKNLKLKLTQKAIQIVNEKKTQILGEKSSGRTIMQSELSGT